MGRFLRGVLAWLCLCGLGLCTAAPTAAVLPAAFAETTLVDFGAAKLALTVNGAVAPEPVPDPVDPARTVLKLSYPAAATGDAEGPALKLPAAALSRVDWRGRDFLALRVYTPDDEALDLVLSVREGEARHDLQAALQPKVWNTLIFPLAELLAQKLTLEKIEEVRVFPRRSTRAPTVYLSTLALLKERDLKAMELPLRLLITGFEADKDLTGWQANGMAARLTEAAHLEGQRALELVFSPYQPGGPRWPSYQARYAERGLPLRDWSGYERFCFEARNPGKTEAPLKLCFRDLTGAQATLSATVPAGGRLAFSGSLRELALDLSSLVQVDLFMSEPAAAHTVWIDDLRLEAAPFEPADRLLERLNRSERDAARRGATDLSTAYRQTREVVAALRSGLEQRRTFGGAHLLAEGVVAAGRQADRLDRDLQAFRPLQGKP